MPFFNVKKLSELQFDLHIFGYYIPLMHVQMIAELQFDKIFKIQR